MSNTTMKSENIELSLPINAAYVSAARLTASSIANRIGFDVDEIEDVKTAVSEACTFIIKKIADKAVKEFKISFIISTGVMEAVISCTSGIIDDAIENELSIMMIKALVDKMEISKAESGSFSISMKKTHSVSNII